MITLANALDILACYMKSDYSGRLLIWTGLMIIYPIVAETVVVSILVIISMMFDSSIAYFSLMSLNS